MPAPAPCANTNAAFAVRGHCQRVDTATVSLTRSLSALLVLFGDIFRRSCLDECFIPKSATLQDASLRRVVHVVDSKPLGIPRRPLEIVEQRPHEVPTHVNT